MDVKVQGQKRISHRYEGGIPQIVTDDVINFKVKKGFPSDTVMRVGIPQFVASTVPLKILLFGQHACLKILLACLGCVASTVPLKILLARRGAARAIQRL